MNKFDILIKIVLSLIILNLHVLAYQLYCETYCVFVYWCVIGLSEMECWSKEMVLIYFFNAYYCKMERHPQLIILGVIESVFELYNT